MLELKECSKYYKNKTVFESIHYSFKNEIYWLTGSNGIGKSVLLRCLVGLEDFSKGGVSGELGKVLYLPDTAIGENWLTMDENIQLMQYYFKIDLSDEKIAEIKESLGIRYGDDLISQVSAGTAMKVGLFLIFLENYWGTIVLDETLSHIDDAVKNIILTELEKRKKEGTCILITNHGELYEKEMERRVCKLHLDENKLIDVI